MSIFTWSNGIF